MKEDGEEIIRKCTYLKANNDQLSSVLDIVNVLLEQSKPEFGSNEKDNWDWDDAPTSWQKSTDQRQSDIEDPFEARDKFGGSQAADMEIGPMTDDVDWDSGADTSQRSIPDTKSAGPKKTLKLSKGRGNFSLRAGGFIGCVRVCV